MVFVHGFGTDQTAWKDVASAFSDDHQIVLLDNAGAGRSAPDAFVQHRYLNLHQYANDVIEVCAALGVRDATLVGHSVGGMIGVLAALDRPDMYARLVLIAASPRYLDEPGYRGGFAESDLEALYRGVASNYSEWADGFATLTNPGAPAQAAVFATCLKTIPPENALTVLCSIFQSDHRADVARLRQPTLIIQAREDVAVPLDVANYLHRSINHSELCVVDARGHMPHITEPAEVVAAMRRFVEPGGPVSAAPASPPLRS